MPDDHNKKQHALTALAEAANIDEVKAFSFAPPGIRVESGHVVSPRGATLLAAMRAATLPCAMRAAAAGFSVLATLHDLGYYHLDAKLDNFIVLRAARPGCASFVDDSGSTCHVYLVDYETLRPPNASPDRIRAFNEIAVLMRRFGYKPWKDYGLPHDYRYDVHSLAASIVHSFKACDTAAPLLRAMETILNHTPESVWEDTPPNPVKHTCYLLSTDHPIVTAANAAVALLRASETNM